MMGGYRNHQSWCTGTLLLMLPCHFPSQVPCTCNHRDKKPSPIYPAQRAKTLSVCFHCLCAYVYGYILYTLQECDWLFYGLLASLNNNLATGMIPLFIETSPWTGWLAKDHSRLTSISCTNHLRVFIAVHAQFVCADSYQLGCYGTVLTGGDLRRVPVHHSFKR